MDFDRALFQRPKLRSGVAFASVNGVIEVEYRSQGCAIQLADISSDYVFKFLKELKNGSESINNLKNNYHLFGGSFDSMLMELDSLGLLEEAETEVDDIGGVLSGVDFYYSRLLPAINRVQSKLGDSPLYTRMKGGTVTKNELIGFALEYYHLVRLAPGLIGPSLSHCSNGEIRALLLKLFVEEYDHDKMMAACLGAVGIDESDLVKRQPLASSFAAYASLGVYARQHIFSFFSALMLFETPSNDFNNALVIACKNLDVTEGFYRPLVKHSDINEEEEHGLITLRLFEHVPVISQEEQNTILIHTTALVEMLFKQDRDIVDYYSRQGCDLLRVF